MVPEWGGRVHAIRRLETATTRSRCQPGKGRPRQEIPPRGVPSVSSEQASVNSMPEEGSVCIPNISPRERRKRLRFGGIMFDVGI